MDLAAYRSRVPCLVRLPGPGRCVVGLRPLPPADIDAARLAVQRLWEAVGAPLSGATLERAFRVAVLAQALVFPVEPWLPMGSAAELSEGLTGAQLDHLFARWLEVQHADVPPERGNVELELAMAENDELVLEALAAASCRTPVDYYGRPVIELTAGQLMHFWKLRAAGIALSEDNGTTRCRSIAVLESQRASA